MQSTLSSSEEKFVVALPLPSPPIFLRLRSSTAFISFAVAVGLLVDLSGYGLIVPVIPFRLEELGYPITSVGSKVGWCVAAYAFGLILSTPGIAWAGERIQGRRGPLLVALLFMAGALVLMMETSSFPVMLLARFLQGVSGTGIWTLGLALVNDSCSSARVGTVIGFVMIGSSVGNLVGPPIGGILYAKLGYRAPFIFALILVLFDLILRLLVIEKHVALEWIAQGVDIPGFEAPGYSLPSDNSDSSPSTARNSITDDITDEKEWKDTIEDSIDGDDVTLKEPSVWSALGTMVTSSRPISLLLLTTMNGFVVGGIYDTGMVLWLHHRFDLDSLGAGLVFLGAVLPSFIASPAAGWLADKSSAKWPATLGTALLIPIFGLMAISGPLALFVALMVLLGFSLSFSLTPILQDLSHVVSSTPGLGAAHIYGAFNLCFSIGCAIGPLVAGQIIGALGIAKGWIAVCIINGLISLFLVPLAIMYVGNPPVKPQVSEGIIV